jgi:hypothetical protein
MYEITARDMLRFEPSELWEHLTGDFTLVFDNGEKIETNAIMTFFSSFAWVYHRKYPLTPLLPKHHVQVLLNGRRYSANTHLEILGVALESTYASYLDLGEQLDRDVLAEVLFYDGMSAIYNDWSYRFEEYVASISILNFTEILDDPEIKANKEAQVPEAWSIEEAYKVMDRVLNDPTKFQNNPVVLAYRSKLVNANQLQQSLGPRGYVTDTDSHQFRYPIMRGYVEGLRRFYDSLIESRSASKALQFSKANLRDAEYFSRKLQLACMQVKRLHKGDCGAKEYLLWTVQGEKFDDQGRKISSGDLPLIVGANYLDEESGRLKAIQGNEKHFVGKTIKLRNPIFCNHADADGICETCFGELSLQVPKLTNIGHLCCVTMTEPSTQSVLSVKHLDGNATIESIVLDMADVMFLKASRDRQSYLLHDRLAKLQPKLIIPSEDAQALNDVMSVDDVEDFNISRISELDILGIQYTEKGQRFLHSAQVHMGKRKSSMTYALLNHIRRQGRLDINNEGNFEIDLAGWNYSEPVLALPLRHFNMSDHSKEISAMLQATKDQMQQRDKDVRPSAFLAEFFKMVNNKLSVNLAPLSVILYAIMIVSAEQEDYRLPKPWTKRGIGTYDFTMSRRSLSATMAYQDHYDIFISPESFVLGHRPDHIFDGLLLPFELYGGQQPWTAAGGQYALQ